MAVEAVMSVVLQKLIDLLKGQSLTQNKFIVYEVEGIMKSLNSMKELMKMNQQAEEHLNAVYGVEDGIERFVLNVVRQRKVFGFLTNHVFVFKNLNSCQKIHHKVKKITTQLMQIKDHVGGVNDEETAVGVRKTVENPPPKAGFSSTSGRCKKLLTFTYSYNEEVIQIVGMEEEEEFGIFGLKEDVEMLVERLTDDSVHVISIVGLAGIGKTTLARTIYKHIVIKHHFEFRAWVTVLEGYTTKDILLTLSKQTDNMEDKATNMNDEDAVKLKLSTYLKNKRYLVILDGVSACSIWEDIKETFPDVKNGSKLVLTSSQTMKAIDMDMVSHHMMPLSEDDSLKMFKEKVGKEKNWSLVSKNSKQGILDTCKGLPLNIVLLAGLFSMKDPSSWSTESSRVVSDGDDSVDIFSLCYNDLTDNLKVCLLYLVLFPKEFDIPVRRLLRLWLAEGFVKHDSTMVCPEDIAQAYFEELVNRNLIQVTKLRSDNSPRGCRVLRLLHDYLLPKAQKTNFLYTHSSYEAGSLNIRRMVEYETPKSQQENERRELAENENLARNQFNPSHLRSYVSFNRRKTDFKQAKRIGSFLGNIINDGFALLRVLDLEGVYKPILPENLGKLCNLRYLGLRFTYLDSIPPSVGELTHLETLDMKHTCIDEIPPSVSRLKNLRHLNLNETSLDLQPESPSRLLALWGLFLDEKVSIKKGLDRLQDLRELGITFNLSSNQEELMDWITNLRALRSLRLRSKDNLGRPSKLVFTSMSNLGQLSHLNLLGSLEKLPDQGEFPPTLKVLTLSLSVLKQDPMQTLGRLPCLTVLRLLGRSYIGKEMVCRKGRFSKLRVLKMWMLKELESWCVEEGSMQSLKHLDIRCCDRLSSIPTTLLKQQRLENLVLTGMPQVFTAEVEGLKSDHTSITVNHWKFPPLPWEQHDNTLVKHSKA